MGCAASTPVRDDRGSKKECRDLIISEHAPVHDHEDDASSTVSEKVKYYMSSSSSCSSRRSTGTADAAREGPRDYMTDVSSATNTKTNHQSSDKCIKTFVADVALKSDSVDLDEEVGVPDNPATKKQVVQAKQTMSTESSKSFSETTERSPVGEKVASIVQSSIVVEDWKTPTLLEAQGASSEKIEDIHKESDVVQDAVSKHSMDKRKTMEVHIESMEMSIIGPTTSPSECKTETQTLDCESTLPLAVKIVPKSATTNKKQETPAVCNGYQKESERSETSTSSWQGASLAVENVAANHEAVDHEVVLANSIKPVAPNKIVVGADKKAKKQSKATKAMSKSSTVSQISITKPDAPPKKKKVAGKPKVVTPNFATASATSSFSVDSYEESKDEANVDSDKSQALLKGKERASKNIQPENPEVDISERKGNINSLHGDLSEPSRGSSESKVVVEETGDGRFPNSSSSIRSFISEDASESDTEESDEEGLIKEVKQKATKVKTSKKSTTWIEPNSHHIQSDTPATCIEAECGNRVARHSNAPRLERNLSNELELLSMHNFLRGEQEARNGDGAVVENTTILRSDSGSFSSTDDEVEKATIGNGMRKVPEVGHSNNYNYNEGLHESQTPSRVKEPNAIDRSIHSRTIKAKTNHDNGSTAEYCINANSKSHTIVSEGQYISREWKATENKRLGKSLSSPTNAEETDRIVKPHEEDDPIENTALPENDSASDYYTKDKSTSKLSSKKTKTKKKAKNKSKKKSSADREHTAECSTLPDWLQQTGGRKGVFGIAGSVFSQSKLDTAALDSSQSSSVSQRSIENLKHPKKRLSQQGLINLEDVTDKSRKYAKELKEKARDSQNQRAEFYNLLNLNPWETSINRLDEKRIVEIVKKHPQHCGVTYNFESFHGSILPLAALCALGASVTTIEKCFQAYEPAMMETDAMVGTPVHYACAYNASLEVVTYLIKKESGALRERNASKRLPLHMACLFGASYSVISYLVHHYPNACRRQDKDGMTPLHLLCDLDDIKPCVVRLISEEEPCACLTPTKEDGSTPLHLAIARKAPHSAVRALISANDTALSTKDRRGRIPLFVAVAVRSPIDTFKFLLLKYPDGRTTRNMLNELPVTMAARMNLDGDLLDLLQPI